LYDLDSISVELEETKEHRLAATDAVKNIISEELTTYIDWHREAHLRAILAQFKISVSDKVKTHFKSNPDNSNIIMVTNQVMKKLIVENQTSISPKDLNSLISKEISLLNI
jgi:glutamyl-tRNA reductase